MASGSNRFLQYAKQTTPRELPTPATFKRLRTTGGSGLVNSRTNITSNEIRSDRQIVESRLGQNQPDVSIPFELSFDSFDELIQGAMGGEWQGGYTVVGNATATATGQLTKTTGNWTDEKIAVGDYVLVNGGTESNLVGVVASVVTNVLQINDLGGGGLTMSAETADYTLVTGHYAEAVATTLDVVASAGTITRGAGSWLTLGVEVGDKIMFTGFSSGGNNGWKEVTAVEALVLTVAETMVDESAVADAVTLITSTGFITVGTGLDYFAVEEGFTDITTGVDIDGQAIAAGAFHNILGCYVGSMALNIQPDAVLTGEFGMQGLVYSGFKNATVATGVEESNVNGVLDSFTGNLFIPDAPEIQGVVTGMNLTLDNGLTRRFALMDQNALSIGDGRSNVNGTLNCYFMDASVSNLFEKEQEFSLAIRTEDLSGNSYTFGFPRVKLTSDGRDVTENDVTQNVGFQALGGAATDAKKTLYILRQPVVG